MKWGTWRREPKQDVVFYTPWLGSMLAAGAPFHPGGAEVQVLRVAQALAQRGLTVAIIVFGSEYELPEEVDGVRIVVRPEYTKPRRILDKCVEISHIWWSLWRVPSRTIVYRTAGFELGVISVYARLARRRLVFSSANVCDFQYHKLESRRLYLWIYHLGVRLANAIIVQTDEQADLCKAAFDRQPVVIKSIAPLGEQQDDPPEAFLWVGRLVSYKQPLEYVELARSLPEAKFWMVGVPSPWTHHDNDSLAQMVARESVEVPNLELLPPQPHDQVGRLMARAVASVNTSDFEGMPNTLLEGWSRGVPGLVMSHDPAGVVESYGLGGFARGSRERLVELAREQWADRNDRSSLSERCQRYIQDHHAPESVADQWARVVLAGGAPGTRLPTVGGEDTCAA